MNSFFVAVNAVSVVVLVGVTIWYAASTSKILEAMKRQADLLSASVELQAILAELQALQSKDLEPQALKAILGLQHRIREIRASQQVSRPRGVK